MTFFAIKYNKVYMLVEAFVSLMLRVKRIKQTEEFHTWLLVGLLNVLIVEICKMKKFTEIKFLVQFMKGVGVNSANLVVVPP